MCLDLCILQEDHVDHGVFYFSGKEVTILKLDIDQGLTLYIQLHIVSSCMSAPTLSAYITVLETLIPCAVPPPDRHAAHWSQDLKNFTRKISSSNLQCRCLGPHVYLLLAITQPNEPLVCRSVSLCCELFLPPALSLPIIASEL